MTSKKMEPSFVLRETLDSQGSQAIHAGGSNLGPFGYVQEGDQPQRQRQDPEVKQHPDD